MRNLAPAFASLMPCYDVIKALAGCISQQVRILQFTPAEPGRCSLRLQRRDGNAGLRRNSLQIRCARGDSAEQEKQYRGNET